MKNNPPITQFDFALISPPCRPGADAWSIKINFKEDISEVLPLLNAELQGAQYNHKAKVLVWKGDDHKYAFRPHEISVAPLEDREQANELCQEAVRIVNKTWDRRDEIEPDYSKIEPPSVMEIYKQLPRSNCKDCGYATCMAFAAAYRDGKEEASDCPHVAEEALP